MIAYTEGKLEEARAQGPAESGRPKRRSACMVRALPSASSSNRCSRPTLPRSRNGPARASHGADSHEDWIELERRWSRRLEFPDFTDFRGESGMRTHQDMMFKALLAIGSADFTALPADVRQLVRARRAPRPLWWFAAIEFAAHLREAEANHVPRLTAELQSKIDASE
jgi:hypothetical protein